MDQELQGLKEKVNKYHEMLENTKRYRQEWKDGLKKMITGELNEIIRLTGLRATIEVREKVENLEAVVLDLGRSSSGIVESHADAGIHRTMIKTNGLLVYQQLFNGKIMVMIGSPHIEGHGEPKPLRPVEILRPDELKKPFFYRHVEALLKDITDWEDFDDNDPVKAPIGFQPEGLPGTGKS
jgi:hypothetical protein